MTRLTLKKTLPPRRNAHNIEDKPIDLTVGHARTSTTVGENPTVISQITASTVPPEVVVSLPQVTSVPTTHKATQNLTLDPKPPFPLNFTLPQSGRELPYSMSTTMMVGLQTNTSTYVNNTMAIELHIDP